MSTMSPFGEVVMQSSWMHKIFKVEKTMCAYYTARIGAPFQVRTLPLFLELG